MLEAQLLRLIQNVLPQVVLLAVDPAFRVLVSLRPVLAALRSVFLPRRAHVVVGGIPATSVVMLVLLLVDPLEVLPFPRLGQGGLADFVLFCARSSFPAIPSPS